MGPRGPGLCPVDDKSPAGSAGGAKPGRAGACGDVRRDERTWVQEG